MSRLKVISRASVVGRGRENYISRVKVKENEESVGEVRPMFSDKANRLNRGKATTLLKDGIEGNSIREIMVSLSQEQFAQLGSNDQEREHYMRMSIRQGMKVLLKELKATNANWVASLHRNTETPHVHILIGEKFKTETKGVKSIGSLSNEKPLPKAILSIEGDDTKLNNIFNNEIEKYWKGLQPNEQLTHSEKGYLLPPNSSQFYEKGFEYFANQMIMPQTVSRLENKTLLYREQGTPVFVKRDAQGNVTGGSWQAEKELGSRKWMETGKGNGWFYSGNLNEANKIVIVDSPLEVIAIESQFHKRDLSKVAFINLGNKENIDEFLELVEDVSRKRSLELVWAKSNTSTLEEGEFIPNETGRENLQELVNDLSSQGKQISLRNFQPRLAKTWSDELKISEVIRLNEWKAIKQTSFVVKEYLQSQNLDEGFQPLKQIDTLPAKPEVLNGTKAQAWKLKKEAENIASQQPTEEELRKFRQQVQSNKSDIYQKQTEELRRIPIHWVANLYGLEEKERGVFTDTGKQFKLKIWKDRNTFDDYYNSKKLGSDPAGFRRAGAVNLAIYLSNHSLTYQEAREQLIDRFIGFNASPLPELKKDPILAEPLQLSTQDDEKLDAVIAYLENRGISRETIDLAVNNHTVLANNFGSAVFVMRDFEGSVIGHNWRSIEKGDTRRQNTTGTFKEFGSFFLGDPKTAEEVVLVEAPIEALSYYDLNQNKDWSKTAVISLHGISITETLSDFIKESQIKKLTVALNNSVEADKVAARYAEVFQGAEKKVAIEAPFIGEDWNDYLQSIKTQESIFELDMPSEAFAAHLADDLTEHSNTLEELEVLINEELKDEIQIEQAGVQVAASTETTVQSEIETNQRSEEELARFEQSVLRIEGRQFDEIRVEDFRQIFENAFDNFIADHPRQDALKPFKADFVDASLNLTLSLGENVGELATGRKRTAPEKILYSVNDQGGEYFKRPEAYLIESVLQTSLPTSPVGLSGYWSSLKRNGLELFTPANFVNENLEKFIFSDHPYFEDEVVSIVETENPLVLEANLASGLVWTGTAESEGQIAILSQAYSTSVMRHAELLNRRGEYLKNSVEAHQFESETVTARISLIYDNLDGLYRAGYEAATIDNYRDETLDLLSPGFLSRKEAITYAHTKLNDFLQAELLDQTELENLKSQFDEKLFGVKKPEEVVQIPLLETADEVPTEVAPLEVEPTPTEEPVENFKVILNRQSELNKDREANKFITKFEREGLSTALRLFEMTDAEKADLGETLDWIERPKKELKGLSDEEQKQISEKVSVAAKTYREFLPLPTTKIIDNPQFNAEENESAQNTKYVEVPLTTNEKVEMLIASNQEKFDLYNHELAKFKNGEERVSFLELKSVKQTNGEIRTEISGEFWSDVHQRTENESNLFGETESKRGGYEKETFILDKIQVNAKDANQYASKMFALSEFLNKIEGINTEEVFKPILDKANIFVKTRLTETAEKFNQQIEHEKYQEWLVTKELASYSNKNNVHRISFNDGVEWKGQAIDTEDALNKASIFRDGLKLRDGLVNAKGEYLPTSFQQEQIWEGNGHLILNYVQDAVSGKYHGYVDVSIENDRKTKTLNFQQAGFESLTELKAKSALETYRLIKADMMPRAGLANFGKFENALTTLELFERSSYEQLNILNGEQQNYERQTRQESETTGSAITDSRERIEHFGNAETSEPTITESGQQTTETADQISEIKAENSLSDSFKSKFSGFWSESFQSGTENVLELEKEYSLSQAKEILGSKGMDVLLFEHLDDTRPYTKSKGQEIYNVLLNELSYRLLGDEFRNLTNEDRSLLTQKVSEKLERSGFIGIQTTETTGLYFQEENFNKFAELNPIVSTVESETEVELQAETELINEIPIQEIPESLTENFEIADRPAFPAGDLSAKESRGSLILSGNSITDAAQIHQFLQIKAAESQSINEFFSYFYGDIDAAKGFWDELGQANINNNNFTNQSARESYISAVLPKYLYKEMNTESGSRMKHTEDLISYFEKFGNRELESIIEERIRQDNPVIAGSSTTIDLPPSETPTVSESVTTEITRSETVAEISGVLNHEHLVFVALGQQILDSTGGQFGYASDAQIPEGMTNAQFKGYIGQLVQKGFYHVSEDEFTSLTVGENFEAYANENNLFVGRSFEFPPTDIEIIGKQLPVTEEVPAKIETVVETQPEAAEISDIVSSKSSQAIPTIGFTKEYYTLWYVIETPEGERFTEYVQNLSHDLEKAKASVTKRFAKYEIDLDLRGAEDGIGDYSEEEGLIRKYAEHEFHYGKLKGQDIRESTDVWQLNRARQFEFYEDTQKFAHDRMIELGELHEHQDEWKTNEELARLSEINDWHFENGERITLDLTVKYTNWFETSYGSSAIQIFKDNNNRIYKYLGSSPLLAEKDEIITVKGTVEHSEYEGQKETKLKRLKQIETAEKQFIEENDLSESRQSGNEHTLEITRDAEISTERALTENEFYQPSNFLRKSGDETLIFNRLDSVSPAQYTKYEIFNGSEVKIADLSKPEVSKQLLNIKKDRMVASIENSADFADRMTLQGEIGRIDGYLMTINDLASKNLPIPFSLKNAGELGLTELAKELQYDGISSDSKIELFSGDKLLKIGNADFETWNKENIQEPTIEIPAVSEIREIIQPRQTEELSVNPIENIAETQPEAKQLDETPIAETQTETYGLTEPEVQTTESEPAPVQETPAEEDQTVFYKVNNAEKVGREMVVSFYKYDENQKAFGYKKYIWGNESDIQKRVNDWKEKNNLTDAEVESLIQPVTDERTTNGVSTFRKKIWELGQEQYLDQQFVLKQMNEEEKIDRGTYRINELESIEETRRLRKAEKTELSNLRLSIPRSEERLESFELGETTVSALGRHYVAEVAKSISKGEVPNERRVELSELNPAFRKAIDNRERYEKGRNTSFGNRTQAVDDSMLEEKGYKVKRQDGKEITETQKEQIAEGVSELEQVFGGLKGFLRKGDITIVHTSGKMPFLSTAGGKYIESERSIVIGVQGGWTGQDIPSLAHEFGHWLDNEAGTAVKELDNNYKAVNLYSRSSRKSIGQTSMLSEMDNYHDSNGERNTLISRAVRLMNGTKYNPKIDLALKAKNEEVEAMPVEEQRLVEISRTVLGNYWYSPREVFARLVEQYVSEKLEGNTSISAEKDYSPYPAYWSKEKFELLRPDLEKAINERFQLVAQKLDIEYAEKIVDENRLAETKTFGNELTAQVTVESDQITVSNENETLAVVSTTETDKEVLLEKLNEALELVENNPINDTNAEEFEALAELREEAKAGLLEVIQTIQPEAQIQSDVQTQPTTATIQVLSDKSAEGKSVLSIWKPKPVSLTDVQGNSKQEKAQSYQKELAVRQLAAEFLNDVDNDSDSPLLNDQSRELAAKMFLVGEVFEGDFTFNDVIARAKKFTYEDKRTIIPEIAENVSESNKPAFLPETSEREFVNAVNEPAITGTSPNGTIALAEYVNGEISKLNSLGNNTDVALLAERFFGSHISSGEYTSQDIYNAVELGANLWVKDNASRLLAQNEAETITELENIQSLLPTQNARTDEKIKLQQFSTPLTESYAAFKLANVTKTDVILEPSAGTGNLAAWGVGNGNYVIANEIDPKRADCLKYLGCDEVHTENAEFLNSTLAKTVKPTVVIMNPPFSSSVLSVKNNSQHGSNHVVQALNRMEEGGRLVAILGEGASFQKSGMEKFWDKVYDQHTIVANVGVDGREYYKFGTTFGNQLIVIDKIKNELNKAEAVKETVTAENQTIKGIIENYANQIINRRDQSLVRQTGASQMERDSVADYPGNGRSESIETGGLKSEGSFDQSDAGSEGNDGLGGNRDDHHPVGNNTESTSATGGDQSTETGVDERIDKSSNFGLGKKPFEVARNEAFDIDKGKTALPNDVQNPTPNKFQTGQYAIESIGDDPYIFELRMVDPKTLDYAEKYDSEGVVRDYPTTQKYAGWYQEGILPEPATVIFNQTSKEYLSTNRRRVVAARMAGITEIPVWFEIGKHKEIIKNAALNGQLDINSEQGKLVLNDYPLLKNELKLELQTAAQNPNQGNLLNEESLNETRTKIETESLVKKLTNEVKSVITFEDNSSAKVELPNGSVQYQVERFTGAQPHPATIVESASLSAVKPPKLDYVPAIPKSLIESGKLSDLQLEAVILAGQRHEKWLEGKGWSGFILGDGTGLGKTAEFLAIGLDKWNRGRKRILFLTLNNNALPGLQSEMERLEMSHIPLQELSTFKIGETLENKFGDGILFATYPTFISEGKDQKTRYDQILKWLGDDGVILMDESHRMQNYLMARGKGSQTGEKGVQLQRANPNFQVVYGSATFAKDVNALAPMDRLELWGAGTNFPGGFQDFKSEIGAAGTGAMELVAFNLKAVGAMVSREISWLGAEVVFEEKKLEPEQIDVYDKTAKAWQLVYQKMEEAFEQTGANRSQTERMTRQMFFGASQRFYRNFILATKVPMLQELGDKYLNQIEDVKHPTTGEMTKHQTQVVLGIMGTGEARTEAQVKRASMDNLSLDELDFSPKETIVDFVRKHFPTTLHTEVIDADGNTTVVKVTNSNGEEVQSEEAIQLQAELLAELSGLDLPDNPLDAMVNYWGRENVAEITGRKRGIYINPSTGQKEYARRVESGPMDQASRSEMEAFQSGRKRLSIVSRSSSASINLHDDANRPVPANLPDGLDDGSRRIMILGEMPPSSVDAVQLLGRVLRSHSRTQPKYVLPLTDIPGETRFLMMVAQKLETMGAITKGDREKASGMDLSEYNLENEYGNKATYAVLTKLNGKDEDLVNQVNTAKNPNLEEQTGKSILFKMGIAKKRDGMITVNEDTIEQATSKQFFNRLLMLDFKTQGVLCDEFYNQYMKAVENDKAMGLFDEGVQGIKGSNIRISDQKVVNTDLESGAETLYSKVLADVPTRKISVESVMAKHEAKEHDYSDYRDANFYHNQTSGNIIFVEKAGERKTGRNTETSYRILTPSGKKGYIKGDDLSFRYSRVTPDSKIEIPDKDGSSKYVAVSDWWKDESDKVPEFITEEHHIISGKVLDVWKRMKMGNINSQGEEIGKLRTVRVKFENGERLLGIELPQAAVTKTLRELNAVSVPVDGKEIHDLVMNAGEKVDLIENISLSRSNFKGQKVIEVKGLDYTTGRDAVDNFGVKKEYYSFRNFYFLPKHPEQGIEVIEKLLKRYPVLGDENTMKLRGVENKETENTAPKNTLIEESKMINKQLLEDKWQLQDAINRNNINQDQTVWHQGETKVLTNELAKELIDKSEVSKSIKVERLENLKSLQTANPNASVEEIRANLDKDSRHNSWEEAITDHQEQILSHEQYALDLSKTLELQNAQAIRVNESNPELDNTPEIIRVHNENKAKIESARQNELNQLNQEPQPTTLEQMTAQNVADAIADHEYVQNEISKIGDIEQPNSRTETSRQLVNIYRKLDGLEPVEKDFQLDKLYTAAQETSFDASRFFPLLNNTKLAKEHLVDLAKSNIEGAQLQLTNAQNIAAKQRESELQNSTSADKTDEINSKYDSQIARLEKEHSANLESEKAKLNNPVAATNINALENSPKTEERTFTLMTEKGEEISLVSKKNLSFTEKLLEQENFSYLQDHVEEMVETYQEANGKQIINADRAKEQFEIYNANRLENDRATQISASAMTQLMFQRKLDALPENSKIILTAGGQSSGKSTVIRENQDADLIYDSVMSNKEGNRKVLDMISEKGHTATVIYVHRPIEESAVAMMKRQTVEVRSVSEESLANGHYGAQQAFINDTDQYARSKGFEVVYLQTVENEPSELMTFNELKEKAYNSKVDALERAKGAIDQEYELKDYSVTLRDRIGGNSEFRVKNIETENVGRGISELEESSGETSDHQLVNDNTASRTAAEEETPGLTETDKFLTSLDEVLENSKSFGDRITDSTSQIIWKESRNVVIQERVSEDKFYKRLWEKSKQIAESKLKTVINLGDEDVLKDRMIDNAAAVEFETMKAKTDTIFEESSPLSNERYEILKSQINYHQTNFSNGKSLAIEEKAELLHTLGEFTLENRDLQGYNKVNELREELPEELQFNKYRAGRENAFSQAIKEEACYSKAAEHQFQLNNKDIRMFVENDEGKVISRQNFTPIEKEHANIEVDGWSANDVNKSERENEELINQIKSNGEEAGKTIHNGGQQLMNSLLPFNNPVAQVKNMLNGDFLSFHLNPAKQFKNHPAVQLMRGLSDLGVGIIEAGAVEIELQKAQKLLETQKEVLNETIKPNLEFEAGQLEINLKKQTNYLNRLSNTALDQAKAGEEFIGETVKPLFVDNELEMMGEIATKAASVNGMKTYHDNLKERVSNIETFGEGLAEKYGAGLESAGVELTPQLSQHLYDKSLKPATIAQEEVLSSAGLLGADEEISVLDAEVRFSQYVARTGNSVEDGVSVDKYWQEQSAISDALEPPVTKGEVASRIRGQQEFIEAKIDALETKYQIEYGAPESGEFTMKALDEPVGFRLNDDSFRFLNPNDPYTNWSVTEIEGVQNQVLQNKTLFDDTIERYSQANQLLDMQMTDLQSEVGFRNTLTSGTKLLRAGEVSEILDDNAFNQTSADFGHSDIAEQLSKVEVADGIDETASVISVTEGGSEGIKVSKLDSLNPTETAELKDAIVESTVDAAAEAAAAEAAEVELPALLL